MKILLPCFVLLHVTLFSQTLPTDQFPIVGQKMPPFVLNNVSGLAKKNMSNEDLLGKWLILDCWNAGCGYCIQSFPKVNQLFQDFKDRLNIISIGYTGSQYRNKSDDSLIRAIHAHYQQKLNLSFPIVFDSVFFQQFDIGPCPYIIVIDPKGIVRGITHTVTKENMLSFLADKKPVLGKVWRKHENTYSFNDSLPFLVDRNGGEDSDFLFRSVLAKAKDYTPHAGMNSFRIINNRLQPLVVSLSHLYMTAYFGKPGWSYTDSLYGKAWMRPVLRIKDSSLFTPDGVTWENFFSYSVSVPAEKANMTSITSIMRSDLHNYFGYIARVENTEMPCWELVELKNKIRADKPAHSSEARYTFNAVSKLFDEILYYNQSSPLIPFFNKVTGNDSKPIDMNCDFADFNSVQAELRRNGYELRRGKRKMRTLVISDPVQVR